MTTGFAEQANEPERFGRGEFRNQRIIQPNLRPGYPGRSAAQTPCNLMELIEHRFDELSRLQYRIFVCPLGGKHHATAIVLKFNGTYGIGSQGNGDADFMRVITLGALSTWHCHAVVFDLRELIYEWGDAIWGVLRLHFTGFKSLPCALVVSDLCRGGFSSCEKIVPPMFDDLESAITFVGDPARASLEQLFAELDRGQ